MALDRSRLQMVKPQEDGSIICQCPECASQGGDRRGQHLIVFDDGAFACVVYPGDAGHRRAVFAHVGEKTGGTGPARSVPGALRARLTREENAKRLAREKMAGELRQYWEREDIREESPAWIQNNRGEQARAILRLFPAGDVVWVGDHKDSGRERHRFNFRPVEDWIRAKMCPAGPRVCPSSFRPGGFSRSASAVLHRRFLVVESDCLSFGEQGAIFRWLRKMIRLRAVVDTAGRSLHGWFDAPGPGLLREIQMALGCIGDGRVVDPALFNPAQPCRLPGWPRADTGALPELIFLDP
jgi:hypothetical protein